MPDNSNKPVNINIIVNKKNIFAHILKIVIDDKENNFVLALKIVYIIKIKCQKTNKM